MYLEYIWLYISAGSVYKCWTYVISMSCAPWLQLFAVSKHCDGTEVALCCQCSLAVQWQFFFLCGRNVVEEFVGFRQRRLVFAW